MAAMRFQFRSRSGSGRMPTSIAGKLGISVFFSLFAIFGAAFIAIASFVFLSDLGLMRWSEVPAVIERSALEEDRDRDKPYRFDVRYAYTVNGRDYTGTRFSDSEGWTDSHAEVTELLERYPVGAEVTCRVSPDDPAEAMLELPGLGANLLILPFLLIPLIFICIGIGGIYLTWRSGPASDGADAAVSLGHGPGESRAGRGGKRVGAVVCAAFLLMGGGFAIAFFLLPAYRVYQARAWDAAECTILRSAVGERRDSDGDVTYRVEIEFEYEYEGRTYRSNTYDFSGGIYSGGRSNKQAIVDAHPVGVTATAYINPDNPQQAVIERGMTAGIWLASFTLLFPIIGAGGLIGIALHRPKASDGPAPLAETGRPASPGRTSLAAPASAPAAPASQPEQGPVTLERRGASRLTSSISLLIFALVWNGAVFGISPGGFDWFLSIFKLIGIAIAGAAVYQGLRLFNPTVHMTLEPGGVRLGDRFTLDWRLRGSSHRVKQLTITLEGIEEATYTAGTNTRTDKHTFFRQVLAEHHDAASIERGRAQGAIPRNTVHSFAADHNRIVWIIRAHGAIQFWPDVNPSFELTVLPLEPSHARVTA